MYDSFPGEIPLIHATNSKYVYYDKYNIKYHLNIIPPFNDVSKNPLIL